MFLFNNMLNIVFGVVNVVSKAVRVNKVSPTGEIAVITSFVGYTIQLPSQQTRGIHPMLFQSCPPSLLMEP